MDTEKILKLIDAGFTADEIRKLIPAAEPAEPEQNEAPAAPAAPAEPEQNEAPAASAAPAEPSEALDPIVDLFSQRIDAMMKPLEESFSRIAKMAGMPSLANVQPKGIEDIVKNFFKED